jgi:adenylate kinase
MKTIIISGSVGSGKTTLAKKLAKKYDLEYVDVSKTIKEKNLYEIYEKKHDSFIVDTKKLNKFLIGIIKKSKKNLIIDSHLSHYLPPRYVDLCIITRCDLKTLEKRLKKRGYKKNKIRENLDCEIFEVCLNEAQKRKHKIELIDTTNKVNISKIKI